ncbi:MAG: polyketide cyclase [Ferruginibacter sp.]|nr:polyketide cyclase [Ferruginibacter sp.]
METGKPLPITVMALVNAPVEKVWSDWNNPADIMQWAHAGDDWHAPYADNDARTGGSFKTTMAAKDGSFSFDFAGVYDKVVEHELIEYSLADGRKVSITFTAKGDQTEIAETFDPETENPVDMQRDGWQMILNNFKQHAEAKAADK